MNDRARAIAILKQARDMLAERLTEHVLDASEEIIEDAEGNSYMGEIEAIYDQMGSRLTHVSQMISNLPPIHEPDPKDKMPKDKIVAEMSDKSESLEGTVNTELSDGITGQPSAIVSPYVGLEASGMPQTLPEQTAQTPAPISFQTFAEQMLAGNVEAAGNALAVLFGIDQQRAARCAQVFAQRLGDDPEFLSKAKRLRHELLSDRHNGVIMLLYECFGLTGLESIGVMQTLRVQMSQDM